MTDSSLTPFSGIKQSDLIGRLVINRLTAEEVGRVDGLWLDGRLQQVIGMSYRTGLINLKRPMFSWSQLESIGEDSIVITLPAGAVQEKPPENAVAIIGHELWTEDGSKAGVVGDYHFDPETGAVLDYLVIRDEWQGMTSGIYRLYPKDVVSIGQRRMMVSRSAIDQAEQVVGAIAQRVKEFFKSDYQRTLEHLSAAVGETQTIAQRLQNKAQDLAQQAQQKISSVTSISSESTPGSDVLPPSDEPPDAIDVAATEASEEPRD